MARRKAKRDAATPAWATPGEVPIVPIAAGEIDGVLTVEVVIAREKVYVQGRLGHGPGDGERMGAAAEAVKPHVLALARAVAASLGLELYATPDEPGDPSFGFDAGTGPTPSAPRGRVGRA